MEKRRQEKEQQDDLKRYQNNAISLRANAESDDRVANLRRQSKIQAQELEAQSGQLLEISQDQNNRLKTLAMQDSTIATALHEYNQKKTAEELVSRRIIKDSPELNELKTLLQAAQMTKIRSTQMAEKSLIKKQEQTREALLDQKMEHDRQLAVRAQFEEEQRRHIIGLQARTVLQRQIKEREEQKQEAFEQFMRDKKICDNIQAAMVAEDRARLMNVKARQQELQNNIKGFLQERREWREEERRRAEEELAKIREYQILQQRRLDELEQKKKQHADLQDNVLAKLTKEIDAKRKEQEQMENLLYELHWEEAEAKALETIKKKEQKAAEVRREMLEANEFQKKLKQQRAMEQQREEEEFRERMMSKFAADKSLEKMNAQRRRAEMQQYKQDVDKLVEERRKLYHEAAQSELQSQQKAGQAEAQRLEVVERERQRLLREHAHALNEFLPKGIVQTDKDYMLLFGRPPPEHTNERIGSKRREQLNASNSNFRS
jgi:hypothetical protein